MNLSSDSASRAACDAFRFSYMTTNYAAVISLLLITVDRLCAVKWPMFYKLSVKAKQMIVAVIMLWAYVLVLCIIPFFTSKNSECTYNPTKQWSIAMLSANTFLPMLIIIVCYAVIFFTTRRQESTARTGQNHMARALRIAKISVAVVLAFIICWGPSMVYYFLSLTCPKCFASSFKGSELKNVLNFVMKSLTFVDGLLAPLIYCMVHQGIKSGIVKAARNIIGRFPCKRCQYEETETSFYLDELP
eukprot:gene212-828_t